MRTLEFTCTARLPQSPEQIAEHMLDASRWTDFQGWGPLPGIDSVRLERSAEIVGSNFFVTNSDGSTHREEVIEWDVGERLLLRMTDFTAPLRHLASAIDETWTFERREADTLVHRSLAIRSRGLFASILLFPIRAMLRRAIDAHLRTLAAS